MSLDELKNELLSIAESCLKYAKEMKIPSAEFFISKGSLTEIQYTKGKVKSRDGLVSGVGIQVADNQKVGFASCAGFAEDSIRSTLEQAFRIAKNRPADPRFTGFIEVNQPGKDGELDKGILDHTGEDMLSQISDAVKLTEKYDERLIGMTIASNNLWGGHAVANTSGVLEATLNTLNYCYANPVVLDKGERSVAFDVNIGRSVQDISGVVDSSVDMAMKHLGSVDLGESINVPTIWHPLTAGDFLGTVFQAGLNGATVVEKRNPLGEKLNEEIAVKELNLVDDGQDPTKISTTAIDYEGTGRRKTKVIDNGILKSFLFNNYYGKIFGIGSTGNANRQGNAEFEALPTISPTKFVMTPGTKNLEEQVAEFDKAIYIEGGLMGVGHSNFVSGDFSIQATNAYLVEKGEIVKPIKPVSIAGNFFKSLKGLVYIGSDITPSYLPIDTPTLTIEGHTISG